MTSVSSEVMSKSDGSRQILDNLIKKNETKLYKMEANIDEAKLTAAWTGFGLYINKNLRSGKAITIPKFGIITFGAPSVKLNGVTNPEQRDLRLRVPVFLVNKEFVKGVNIQTGIISGGNIRPYSMKGVISGLAQVKVNYTEVGFNAGLEKDFAKICVERVIKELAEKAKSGKNVEMDIPNVGRFLLRIPIAAIEFDEFLINNCLDATNKFVKEQKLKEEQPNLTVSNLNELVYQSQYPNIISGLQTKIVDNSGQNWLKTNFDIDVNTMKTSASPKVWEQVLNAKPALSRASQSEVNSVYSRPVSAFSSISSTSRMSKVNQVSQEKALFVAFTAAKKKIKTWIKTNNLLPEDAYVEIAKRASGATTLSQSKLNYPEFKRGISKINGLLLVETEIEGLTKILDIDRQEFVSVEKWLKVFGSEKSYLSYIQAIVSNYSLQADDVMRRMGLNKNSSAQDFTALKEKLRFLDPSLKDKKAEKIAQELLKGKERIEVSELIKLLGCATDKSQNERNWYRQQLIRLKRKAGEGKNLRQHFEKYDDRSRGLVDIPTFKAALTDYKIEMNIDELTIFTRYVEKDTDMMIDYVNFTAQLDKLKSEEELQTVSTTKTFVELEQFNAINDKIQEYLKVNKMAPRDIVKRISGNKSTDASVMSKVFVENFAEFIHQLFKNSFIKHKSCRDFAKKVDIDKDGFITEADIETFFARNAYIKEGERETKTLERRNTQNKLYPKAALAEEKMEIILRDLRNTLSRKKISFFDFFKSMDTKQTGFLTINDFNTGIDKVMKLSQPIKDGFYAYMDTENLGIVNYDDFLKVFQRSVADKRVDVSEDSFDWQSSILRRIREFALEKELSAEDAFRILDTDFDGFVNKTDLLRFLREVLNIPAEEATQPRVERLFKLMDTYKRGSIQLTDIKMLIQYSSDKNNLILSGGNNSSEKSNFDWRLHARQQIGLILSRQYPNLEASFQDVTERNANMKFTQFTKWIEKNRVLGGFDLTDRLLQKLFADLDPHKKGYLTEADWVNAFAGYNTKNQILSEVQEALTMNYSDITNAYDYFVTQSGTNKQLTKEITPAGFEKALNAILPKRFGNSEMKYLWCKCANDHKSINFRRFTEVFGNLKYTATSYTALAKTIQSSTFLSLSNPQTVASLSTGKIAAATINRITKEEKQKKVFEKLRQILLASNVSAERFFSKADADGSGEINNLEFINAIKSFNLGLNLQEIEDLLMYCDSNQDGRISFQEFVRKFAPQVVENRLFDRSKNRLKKFKENIYFYMLSPKDAFLKFNEDRTGRLTYDQFNNLIIRLHELAKEEVPPFPIIKDLFDFLDIRKDGIIDMTEWMQSFRLIETNTGNNESSRTQLPSRRSNTVDVRSLNKTYYKNSQELNKTQDNTQSLSVSEWECSKEYEKILKIIGKNRKSLIAAFDELKRKKIPVDAATVKEIIGELLSTTGLKITDAQWLYMYKFAEKEDVIDYKFMLDAFKERLYLLSAHPKTSVGNV